MRLTTLLLLAPLMAFSHQAVSQQAPAAAARAYRQTHEYEIISKFVDLLSLPNVASDTPDIRRNAALITRMLEQRGVKTRLLETAGAPPVVYGEINTPGATRTIIFYAHYDGIEPLGETEKRALAEAPDNDAMLRREFGIAWTEGGGKKLVELINLPSLNIRGLASSSVGATARNVIPSTATASIDIRLVKGVDYRQAAARVIEHIRKQGYYVVESEPDNATRLAHPKIIKVVKEEGYNAARTSMDLEISRQVIRAVEGAHGKVIKMPSLGASVPLYIFTDILKTPAIGLPIANHDNNQHSANENIRLQNLWDGIETMAALLTMR